MVNSFNSYLEAHDSAASWNLCSLERSASPSVIKTGGLKTATTPQHDTFKFGKLNTNLAMYNSIACKNIYYRLVTLKNLFFICFFFFFFFFFFFLDKWLP